MRGKGNQKITVGMFIFVVLYCALLEKNSRSTAGSPHCTHRDRRVTDPSTSRNRVIARTTATPASCARATAAFCART